jgi:hypothetical protein
MSNQDGLDPKEFDELIARLSRRKQESPSAKISFQDVKDILQDEGLLESLLKEHVSSRDHSIETIEYRHKKLLSRVIKSCIAASIALIGLSSFASYHIGNKVATDDANKIYLSASNAFVEKSRVLETKIADLKDQINLKDDQINSKDDQIKDLIGKISSALPIPSVSSSADANPLPAGINNASSDTEFDSGSVFLQECSRVDKSVKCSLNIVSKVDQTIGVGYCGNNTKTRFFDPQGVEYKASTIEFASNFNRYGCTVETSLIKDVPAKAVLTFNDVSLETKSIKALEISIAIKNENNTEWKFPQYREIPIK